MHLRWFATLFVMALPLPSLAGDLAPTERPRPRLDVAAMPRATISPSNVVFTAKLVGGDAQEDFYCPEVEWNWSDGARSARLSDCEPYQAGDDITRVFSATHRYRDPGQYEVTVSLRRASRVVAVATVIIDVRPGVPGRY
jgi:hypothetical protein